MFFNEEMFSSHKTAQIYSRIQTEAVIFKACCSFLFLSQLNPGHSSHLFLLNGGWLVLEYCVLTRLKSDPLAKLKLCPSCVLNHGMQVWGSSSVLFRPKGSTFFFFFFIELIFNDLSAAVSLQCQAVEIKEHIHHRGYPIAHISWGSHRARRTDRQPQLAKKCGATCLLAVYFHSLLCWLTGANTFSLNNPES